MLVSRRDKDVSSFDYRTVRLTVYSSSINIGDTDWGGIVLVKLTRNIDVEVFDPDW